MIAVFQATLTFFLLMTLKRWKDNENANTDGRKSEDLGFGQLLKLPFPAGKHLDALSKDAFGKDLFRVKCPGMEFSLSGVQNKVTAFYEDCQDAAETAGYALRCVCHAVIAATKNAVKEHPGLPVVFSGGVASNSLLREMAVPLNPIFAQPQFSTDNAMGVAVLAHRIQEG